MIVVLILFLHYITSHHITLHYVTLDIVHYITLPYLTLHYITLHYMPFHSIPLQLHTLLLDDCASHLHKAKTSIFIFALVSVYFALHKVTAFGFVGSIRFSFLSGSFCIMGP